MYNGCVEKPNSKLKKNKGKDRVSKVAGGHMDAIEKLF